MTEPTLIHRTTDGREFEDIDAAKAHQALLNKIAKFLENRCADRSKPRLTQMLVDWTGHHESSKTEYAPTEEAA